MGTWLPWGITRSSWPWMPISSSHSPGRRYRADQYSRAWVPLGRAAQTDMGHMLNLDDLLVPENGHATGK